MPKVIKEISFKVEWNEKIGIMGRTGSGKSTLLLALTRLIELDDDKGYIKIGKQDISQCNLN